MKDSTMRAHLGALLSMVGFVLAQAPEAPNSLAARVDPYVDKPRIVVMTDIANEPDDQMSMVRFLVYSNEFDVEGLIATTSTWMRRQTRPDVIRMLVDTYEQVRPSLLRHRPGFPPADALRSVIVSGQPGYGMAAVGPQSMTPGAELILRAADEADPRPLWVLGWGGTNTLAQALLHARATRPAADLERLVAKLRVYTISDQDDAGPWIRREFPALHYVASPSTQDGEQYYFATWTGISGDRFYKNAAGADFTTFSDAWVNANRSRRPISNGSSRSSASTQSRIRTMPDRGSAGSFPRCTTSRRRRRRMASSTISRRGQVSAAIASTRTRRAPTSRRSATRG